MTENSIKTRRDSLETRRPENESALKSATTPVSIQPCITDSEDWQKSPLHRETFGVKVRMLLASRDGEMYFKKRIPLYFKLIYKSALYRNPALKTSNDIGIKPCAVFFSSRCHGDIRSHLASSFEKAVIDQATNQDEATERRPRSRDGLLRD